MSHKVVGYASDMTDGQWTVIEPLIAIYKWGRPRELDMRRVVNAISYINKTGCQWAMLPHEQPNYQSVYHHFQRWSRERAWETHGREARPSAASLDSQSVKTTEVGGDERGFDGGRR